MHPDNPESKFPQFKPPAIIDLRSSAIPGAGREWSGGNRKLKMITKEFKDKTADIEEESVHSEEKEKVVEEKGVRMEAEKHVAEPKTGYRAKRKSRLRKTMVF